MILLSDLTRELESMSDRQLRDVCAVLMPIIGKRFRKTEKPQTLTVEFPPEKALRSSLCTACGKWFRGHLSHCPVCSPKMTVSIGDDPEQPSSFPPTNDATTIEKLNQFSKGA